MFIRKKKRDVINNLPYNFVFKKPESTTLTKADVVLIVFMLTVVTYFSYGLVKPVPATFFPIQAIESDELYNE